MLIYCSEYFLVKPTTLLDAGEQRDRHRVQFENRMKSSWFSKSCFKINCHNNNAVLTYCNCFLISGTCLRETRIFLLLSRDIIMHEIWSIDLNPDREKYFYEQLHHSSVWEWLICSFKGSELIHSEQCDTVTLRVITHFALIRKVLFSFNGKIVIILSLDFIFMVFSAMCLLLRRPDVLVVLV